MFSSLLTRDHAAAAHAVAHCEMVKTLISLREQGSEHQKSSFKKIFSDFLNIDQFRFFCCTVFD